MKKFLLIIIISFASCAYKTGIYRETIPVPRIDTTIENNFAMIRTVYADIYIHHVDMEIFSDLNKHNCYRTDNPEKISNPSSYPDFELFYIIVKNKSNYIIRDINTRIITQKDPVNPLTEKTIEENRIYSSYNNIDVLKLFKYRRLVSQKAELKNIDFDKNTFEYDFTIIQKSDAICFFRGFDLFKDKPARYKFQVSYICNSQKKVIDFDLMQIEYRHDSEEYTRYKTKIESEKNKESNLWL